MKTGIFVLMLICSVPLISSCTVTTTTYNAGVYTPAYYPGSPYYDSSTMYWSPGPNPYWQGYQGYYRYRWEYGY